MKNFKPILEKKNNETWGFGMGDSKLCWTCSSCWSTIHRELLSDQSSGGDKSFFKGLLRPLACNQFTSYLSQI